MLDNDAPGHKLAANTAYSKPTEMSRCWNIAEFKNLQFFLNVMF